MTIEQYQELYRIQQSKFDDVDKMALMVCCLFNIEPVKVNEMPPKKFLRKVTKLTKQFENVKQKWWQKRKVEIDATKLTAGQFIELQHWMKDDIVSNLHLIVASILLKRSEHKQDTERVSNDSVGKYLTDTMQLIESLKDLLETYKGLFQDDEDKEVETHRFIEQYGWLFSIESVAEYLRITINQTYEIGILEFLNALVYLKGKGKYNEWLSKQK